MWHCDGSAVFCFQITVSHSRLNTGMPEEEAIITQASALHHRYRPSPSIDELADPTFTSEPRIPTDNRRECPEVRDTPARVLTKPGDRKGFEVEAILDSR